jgi:hypothetical protein
MPELMMKWKNREYTVKEFITLTALRKRRIMTITINSLFGWIIAVAHILSITFIFVMIVMYFTIGSNK